MFVDVAFVLYKAPELTLVVANKLGTVSDVVINAFPELNVVATIFEDVAFVLYKAPELTLVVANKLGTVRAVVINAFPELNVV